MLALLLGSFVSTFFFVPKTNYFGVLGMAFVLIFSLMGVLIWSATYLKIEPNLTRIALISDALILALIALWMFTAF